MRARFRERLSGPQRAITLVELLVVIGIISMLFAMLGLVVPSVGTYMNEQRAKTGLQKLAMVIEMYKKDTGQYPDCLNHRWDRPLDPATPKETIEAPIEAPEKEPDKGYPQTKNANLTRPLYSVNLDEVGKKKQYSEMVWTLGTTRKGWGTPQLFEVFRASDVNLIITYNADGSISTMSGGQLVDSWGRRLFYLPAYAYRINASGARSGSFLNSDTYQLYSAGPDQKTGLDKINKGGMSPDDITNWRSMIQ